MGLRIHGEGGFGERSGLLLDAELLASLGEMGRPKEDAETCAVDRDHAVLLGELLESAYHRLKVLMVYDLGEPYQRGLVRNVL